MIHAYKKLDGTLDFANPIVVMPDNVPDDYFAAEENVKYDYTPEEKVEQLPQAESLEEKVTEHDSKIVTLEESIDVIFGGI